MVTTNEEHLCRMHLIMDCYVSRACA